MHDHPEHIRSLRESYSPHKTPRTPCEPYGAEQAYLLMLTPVAKENDIVGGPSNSRSKSSVENLQASSPGGNDDTQVNSDLLAAWTQRLQILTLVTTFLTSINGQLFALSALNTQIGIPTGTISRELVYSCLSGALVLHVCACVLGFVASFALSRYRIIEASEDDTKVGGIQIDAARLAQRLPRRIILEPVRPLRCFVTFLQRPDRLGFLSASQSSRSSPSPPLSLLTHCYYTTIILTTVGIILALTGILAYVWAGLPPPVGIFTTICLGIGIGASVWALAK